MGSQVTLLIWLRTVVNYQYKNGGSVRATFQKLYKEGCIMRFYRGLATKIISNGFQSTTFTILWKYLEGLYTNTDKVEMDCQ